MTSGTQPAGNGTTLIVWGAIALLAAISIALWVRFGPGVFADMVSSAWRFCF